MKKSIIKKILLKTNLYSLFETINYWVKKITNTNSNKAFLKQHPNVVIPPSFYMYETFGLSYESYYYGGKKTAEWIVNYIEKYVFSENKRILDWGCGPGRVVRHLPSLLDKSKNEFFGADYNQKYVNWCGENISNISFVKNELSPPLKFENGFLDFIYVISIFTHLSEEKHILWIKELNRVLKEEGVILITTHGSVFLNKLEKEKQKLFLEGKFTEHRYRKEGNRLYAAYQPTKFFRKLCESNGFEVLEHVEGTIEKDKPQQDVWILRKKYTV